MSSLGQLIITGISGTVLTEEEANFIEQENIGGVLLFSRNYENPAQLAELVNSIQVLRSEYPLFIAVDQEGGRVQRFKEPFTVIPPMLKVAELESPKTCFHVVKIMAEELNACGINLDFAPVCDILNNDANKVIGDRALGKTEEHVSKFVSSVVRGLQTNGVLACAKHFPGHGCTTKDSHFDLPVVKKSLEDLRKEEFQPFIKAIKARVDFVMMAHLIVDSIDEELPTSLSPKAYQILRDELRFTKIIVTDDMQMKAIADRYSTEEAAVMAISAGADMVEYMTMDEAKKALEGLKAAKKTKQLKNEEINKKIERITNVKKENLSEYKPIYIPEIAKHVGQKASEILINEIKQKIDLENGQ